MPEGGAFTIAAFCAAHHISRAQYYVDQRRGKGPDEMIIGKSGKRISFEAAARWRAQREAEAKAKREDAA